VNHGSIMLALGTPDDLAEVYPSMRAEFADSLKSREQLTQLLATGDYRLYLARGAPPAATHVGYAFVFALRGQRLAWLDYLAVDASVRNHGIGTAIFQAICDQLAPDFAGLMLEVDPPTSHDPALLAMERRRLAWYQRLGSRVLNVDYRFPGADGAIPMLLLCRPLGSTTALAADDLRAIIRAVYDVVHSDVPGRDTILARFISDVRDQPL
jgi:GNAT superfamily N-acetyltransferase